MLAFITGATGFIGSHLTEALHAKGYTLRCLVRKTSNLEWIKHLPIEYVYGDLFNPEILRKAVSDAELIVHVAGTTKARSAKGYFLGNHVATKNLLDAVAATHPPLKRFVHISSQAAVGPSANGVPIDEKTPFHPITAYGESKMEAEKECLKFRDTIPITITRPPAVYGPRDRDVFTFFESVNKGLQPMIGFNNKEVSLIHVRDLVHGILLAAEHPAGKGNTYFISSARYYNWREIGELTSRIMQKRTLRVRVPVSLVYTIAVLSELYSMITRQPVLLNYDKAKDIVQDSWTCSIAKARGELGFSEQRTLEEGIRETVAWYRERGLLK